MSFFKKLFNSSKPVSIKETQIPKIEFTSEATLTSYYTRPKQITHKKVYISDELFSIRGNVIKFRKARKLTQKSISDCLGFNSVSFISRLERGDMQSIKHTEVKNLASCLKVELDDLLLGSERID